jgi:DNA-binding response OmpR family regulator
MGAVVIKILLVARDQAVRDRLRLALERLEAAGQEIEFLEAADGEAALTVAEASLPDRENWSEEDLALVVVQLGAHPYGGFGLTRDLKANPRTAWPVILILERLQDEWLGRWCGADALVNRPVDPFALADVARTLLAREAEGIAPEDAQGVLEAEEGGEGGHAPLQGAPT